MNKDLKILPNYPFAKGLHEHYNKRFDTVKDLAGEHLPALRTGETLSDYEMRLNKTLPLVRMSEISSDVFPATFSFTVLSDGSYTHGTGRFVADTASRFLVPGKQLSIVSTLGSAFKIENIENRFFFIMEMIILIEESSDGLVIQHNFENVAKDIRLSILAVKHARQIVRIKPLSLDQKKIIFEENLASLFSRTSKESHTLFDQAHGLLLKAAGEEAFSRVQQELAPLLELKEHTFDRDIFKEIQDFVGLFKDAFSAIRDPKHLKRMISYQYLFKKILTQGICNQPHKRHTSIKLLRTYLNSGRFKQPVLGVLVGLNFIQENEVFEKRHLLKALQSCFPHLIFIEESYIADSSLDPKVHTYYLEVKKRSRSDFTQSDLIKIRKCLPREITNRIETVVHPVFMHRNEEEIMRGILDLAKQLKYVDDIPQVIINFHRQTAQDISFTVILLRLKKGDEGSLREIFKSHPPTHEIHNHEEKIVGILKKRYTKEANIFDIRLDKKPFLRPDYSVDLYKARQSVILDLTEILGEVRDYNGGMISKQNEVLRELKTGLSARKIQSDFLLENFFYSVTPAYMQSLLSASILETLFLMLLEVLEHDFSIDRFYSSAQILDDTFLIMLGSTNQELIGAIEKEVELIKPDYPDLTKAQAHTYEIHTLGYILRFENSDEYAGFRNTILEAIEAWHDTLTPLEKNPAIS